MLVLRARRSASYGVVVQALLVATTSPGKLREWQGLLAGMPCELKTLRDLGIELEVEETGRTFRDNAVLKAEAYGRASGLLTLAEDSGLSVRALGGAPGIHSARWEGDDYGRKNRLLLERLDGNQGAERACRYVCAVALRLPDGQIWQTRGELRGEIALRASGTGGFGYDPVFWVPRLGRTLADVPDDVKQRISHRSRAAKRLRPVLVRVLEGAGL